MSNNAPMIPCENMGELQRDSVFAVFATTTTDGKIYQVEYDKFCAARAQLPTNVEQHFAEAENSVKRKAQIPDGNKS